MIIATTSSQPEMFGSRRDDNQKAIVVVEQDSNDQPILEVDSKNDEQPILEASD